MIVKETVRQILRHKLNMTKVCAEMIVKHLIQKQKNNQKIISFDIMDRVIEELAHHMDFLVSYIFTVQELKKRKGASLN